MKLKLEAKVKDQDLKALFEKVLDVLSIALNRGITDGIIRDLERFHEDRSNLWMYQKNGSPSDFQNFDRVDLKPCMNDYWLNLRSKSENTIIFDLNFRYSNNRQNPEELFCKILLFLFSYDITEINE